jgi:hypothetical protein
MWNNNHVGVCHKLCGFQGHVGRCIVVTKEPAVAVPKFWSFSTHIFSQASQNVTVKVRVDRGVRRKKLMVNNLLHVEKSSGPAAPSLLLVTVGSSTAMIVALFLNRKCKSNFHHPL